MRSNANILFTNDNNDYWEIPQSDEQLVHEFKTPEVFNDNILVLPEIKDKRENRHQETVKKNKEREEIDKNIKTAEEDIAKKYEELRNDNPFTITPTYNAKSQAQIPKEVKPEDKIYILEPTHAFPHNNLYLAYGRYENLLKQFGHTDKEILKIMNKGKMNDRRKAYRQLYEKAEKHNKEVEKHNKEIYEKNKK